MKSRFAIAVLAAAVATPAFAQTIQDATPARPEVQVPIDPNLVIGGDLELTMIGHVPGEGDTSRCVDALFGEADELPSPKCGHCDRC